MLKDPSNTIMAENREQTSQVKRHLQASSILLLSNTTVCVSSLFLLSIVPNEPQQKTSMYIDTKKTKKKVFRYNKENNPYLRLLFV